jgi:hypothetical protein
MKMIFTYFKMSQGSLKNPALSELVFLRFKNTVNLINAASDGRFGGVGQIII